MAATIANFSKRRRISLGLVFAISLGLVVLHSLLTVRFPRITFASGWGLMGLMLLLTAFNGRKKVPFLQAFSSEAWLQVHIYAGLFASLVFALHLHFRWPTGAFEWLLAMTFILVTFSGFLGLWISRTIPRRLTSRGDEIIFEQIPAKRKALHDRAMELALDVVHKTQSTTIANYYQAYLDGFFIKPRHFWAHVIDSEVQFQRLLTKTRDLQRYLNQEERKVLDEIIQLLESKNRLDYHYSLQLLLKLWLFVHIPLTYGLLVFSTMHIALVYAFSSAAG